MLVRCGRCRTELEVSGAGEFLCPRCGTRNVVRGAAEAPPPYDLPDLTIPGGAPPRPPAPQAEGEDEAPTRWIGCPGCTWRFVIGPEVTEVICPNCRTNLVVDASGAQVAARP